MGKYLLKILLFFLIIIVIDVCFGKGMDYLYFRAKGGETREMNDVCLNNEYDVLIMGSSRAHHHYVPSIIVDSLGLSCYNTGKDGNGIILMYGIYVMILERYTPSLILYDLAKSFDLYVNPQDLDNTRYVSLLKPYARKPHIDKIFKSLSGLEWVKTYSNLYRYNSELIPIIRNYAFERSYNYDGYMKFNKEMNYEPTIFETEDSGVLDTLKLHYFEKFICSTKENGIKLICFLSPRYRSITIERYKPLFILCEQYDIPILNFYTDTTITNHKEFFQDPTHMNDKGARLYTSLILEKIQRNKY